MNNTFRASNETLPTRVVMSRLATHYGRRRPIPRRTLAHLALPLSAPPARPPLPWPLPRLPPLPPFSPRARWRS